jgi:pilus assembly protein Flp/PilA
MISVLQQLPLQIRRFVHDERGASLVEYALLISLIALVAFIAVETFGTTLSEEYSGIAGSIP